VCKFFRSSVRKCAMRTRFIIIASPTFQFLSCVRQTGEHLSIEALVPQPSVEAFHVAVLDGTAGLDKVQFHSHLMCPDIHRLTRELTTVIGRDGFWYATKSNQPFHLLDYFLACLRAICMDAQTLSCVLIDYRQNAEPSVVGPSVTPEVHTPSLIRSHRLT
jgi:hypothetical protein